MLEKRIKINSTSNLIKDKVTSNGHVWRLWTVSLEAAHIDLSEYIDHVEYVLHESFGSPPIVCKDPPYQIQREGWGEFDLGISLYFKDSLVPSPQTFLFDLNFKKSKYSKFKKVVFGSDTEYKQEENALDSEYDDDDENIIRSRHKRRNRHGCCSHRYPHPYSAIQYRDIKGVGGKKSKKRFNRPRTFSSASSSSIISLTTTPADDNNKDVQLNQQHEKQQHEKQQHEKQQHEQQQHIQQPHQDQQCIQHQNSDQYQHIQNAVYRSPHYILNQENDLNLVLETETIDLAELKALLEALNEINLRKVYAILSRYDTSSLNIQETDDGYYLIDISTACSDLINKLWEFVIDVEIDKCKESSLLS